MRNFREYDVWKRGIAFSKRIYLLTSNELPESEKFGIISQLQRASVSISSNIAEGCSRSSAKEFSRFTEIALGSAFETESLLVLCKELGYLDDTYLKNLIVDLHVIQKELNSLRGKLKG